MPDNNFKCSPKCHFFLCPENVSWKWNDEGTYKIPSEPREFYCLYDNEKIESWDKVCPRKMKESKK